MSSRLSSDERLEQALSLLHSLLSDRENPQASLRPWDQTRSSPPPITSRISATDRLSWWFRPTSNSGNPWDSFFERNPQPSLPFAHPLASQRPEELFAAPLSNEIGVAPVRLAPPSGPWASLHLLLSDPEPEIINEDAEAVVACLYDFIHAVGMGDMERAMSCVAEDYHTIEEDQEIDRQGLERQIKTILDSLHGWEYDVSLAEIPQPILHPRAILIYTEIQIDATKAGGKERRATLYRRIAVFRQQPDKSWLITALSPVSRGK